MTSALDVAWLGRPVPDFYTQQLGGLMAESIRIAPAAVDDLGYPLAVVFWH